MKHRVLVLLFCVAAAALRSEPGPAPVPEQVEIVSFRLKPKIETARLEEAARALAAESARTPGLLGHEFLADGRGGILLVLRWRAEADRLRSEADPKPSAAEALLGQLLVERTLEVRYLRPVR